MTTQETHTINQPLPTPSAEALPEESTTTAQSPTPSLSPAQQKRQRFAQSIRGEDDCPICGWSADSVHSPTHEKHCAYWQEACQALNHWPRVGDELKDIIEAARQLSKDADTPSARFDANIKLLHALFDHSLGNAIKNKRAMDHPKLPQYISMVHLDELGDQLRERFPYLPGHIAPGFTFWEPNGSREYKTQLRMTRHRTH